MKKRKKSKLKESSIKWVPRVLIILYIIFLSIFALDTPMFTLEFLIHMIPSTILLIVAIVAWYKPQGAGAFFIMIAVLFTMFFDLYSNLSALLIIALPLLITGVLFYINPKKKKN